MLEEFFSLNLINVIPSYSSLLMYIKEASVNLFKVFVLKNYFTAIFQFTYIPLHCKK